ncbi:lipase family protein [Corynebacterium sanguinis]|uniref:esterase/lipase family protein n=1 Tax=Corynebacterium sanguinis TaxID=2594913 RepID=UPI00223BDE7C|nr:lipase family protein [Corynebacterium sanguinis]MCT1555865.1 lipase family protein [Corynebacterium sanguinis]MCT1613754.1 lipase family protein [Corynebacterium sanguinis]
MGCTAHAQEVANGSSALVAPLTVNGLDARAMGDYVPPQTELDAAFGCAQPTADPAAKKTVVLVPGVGESVHAAFAWNYIPQLRSQGYDVCWVQPPHGGRGDLTQSALYVANGIKAAHERSGDKVAAIGHSAGPPAIMWALRYDAEAASLVDDFISVAGANRGTALIEPVCGAVGNCPVIAWQVHPNSDFVQALHAQPLPDSVDVTSVYSLTDEGIQPATQVSSISSAANIAVQDVCPTHLVGHIGILSSNAAYQLILDALEHEGPADRTRAAQATECSQYFAPGIEPSKLTELLPAIGEYLAALGEPRYASQPPLPSYAQPDVANPLRPDELADGSSERFSSAGQGIAAAVAGSAQSAID